jgi:hypothetical protein
MSASRPHPFDLIFAGIGDERFPVIATEIGTAPNLDTFLAAEAVIQLLHDLRPESGLGDMVDDFVLLVHAAFLYWTAGATTVTLSEPLTRELLAPSSRVALELSASNQLSRYVQVAPQIIWGRIDDQEHHEPLDGWFAIPIGDTLRVVACLGLHPSRPGLSVLIAEGAPPFEPPVEAVQFAPTMTGGDLAGLHSVTTAHELLLLAWRAAALPEET